MNRVTQLLPQHFRRVINRIMRRIQAIEARLDSLESGE